MNELPAPYYEDEQCTIYCADCRDILPLLDMTTIDLVFTDPPYGIEGGQGANKSVYGKGDYLSQGWADTPAYVQQLIQEVLRPLIFNNRRVVLTPGKRCMWMYPEPKDVGCFYTPCSPTFGSWGFQVFQPILYYGKDPRGGKGQVASGIQVTEASEINGHPCPKPLKAWKWLLNKCSLVGETVLDPFGGSGTTARAAKDLGRKCILIEIEERYCEIAVNRLAQGVLL